MRKERGYTSPVPPPNFKLLSYPLSVEGVMVVGEGPQVVCGWSFFHVERYTEGLRSTRPSLHIPPTVASESSYSPGILWVPRDLRSLVFFHLLACLGFTKTIYYAVNSWAFCRACTLQDIIGPGRKVKRTKRAWCKMTNGNWHSASGSRSTVGQGGEWGKPESSCPHLYSSPLVDCCHIECRPCIVSVYQEKPEVWNFSCEISLSEKKKHCQHLQT